MLLDDHPLPQGALLIAPDHQRLVIAVAQEALRDLRLQVCDAARVVGLGEAQELDVAAQDLGPPEVLREAEERRAQRVLAALVLAAEDAEEVEAQDVEQPALQVEGRDGEWFPVAREDVLGAQVAVDQSLAPVLLRRQVAPHPLQALLTRD